MTHVDSSLSLEVARCCFFDPSGFQSFGRCVQLLLMPLFYTQHHFLPNCVVEVTTYYISFHNFCVKEPLWCLAQCFKRRVVEIIFDDFLINVHSLPHFVEIIFNCFPHLRVLNIDGICTLLACHIHRIL